MKRLTLISFISVSAFPVFAQQGIAYPPVAVEAIQAMMPQPADIVPPMDTLNGAVGSSVRYMRQDAPRPTISQRTTTAVDGTGSFSVTWAKPFVSSSPAIIVTPLGGSAQPATCVATARSATAVSGKCWQNSIQAVALISLTITLAPTAYSGNVMIVGIEPSQ